MILNNNVNVKLFTFRYGRAAKRQQGHFFFDKIWLLGLMERDEAHKWLAEKLDLPYGECHFSRMKSSDILKAIKYSIEYLNQATEQRLTDLPIYQLIEVTDQQHKLGHIPKKYKICTK